MVMLLPSSNVTFACPGGLGRLLLSCCDWAKVDNISTAASAHAYRIVFIAPPSKQKHTIMNVSSQAVQSLHVGLRGSQGRTGALRIHDGARARPAGRDHGPGHRRHGTGGPAWRLLPEPALARPSGHGYPSHHETARRCQGTHPQRNGRIESREARTAHQHLTLQPEACDANSNLSDRAGSPHRP